MQHTSQAIIVSNPSCEDEIEAIAEHERLSPDVAAELLDTLLQSFSGICLIKLYLLDNIEVALEGQQLVKARRWQALYRRFDAQHPGADPADVRILH